MFSKSGNLIKEFGSMADANAYIGKPRESSGISACCKGRRKSAYGYIWKYKNEEN